MEEDEWDDALLSEIAALESRHLQNHSHQNQPTAAGVWICRSCTLQNEASRGTCLVCSTPRGQSYKAAAPAPSPVRASTAPRKTIQARLSFDGTSAPVAVPPSQQRQQQGQEADVGRSEPSLFMASKEQPVRSSQQTVLTLATTRPGLVLTSRRSGHGAAATSTRAAASPVQMPRRAAGEDSQAKTRYLDIMARSNFPQIDYEAAQNFVYPTNYSIRDYQLTIAEKALYHNTLVSLPTGLGKTLVAAVVMYNFYRWFPTGKIVFMAPTKPLVAQQIKACHEIMGIPLSDTAELQGNVPPTMRRVLWSSRRVFFCTPQSLQNDLRRGVCAAEKFVCIVVDEAHRATGNYAYCCVVQEIEAKTHFFRVLALSATPGAKFDVIQDVVTNLRISHIESRSADDPDVKKYTHARQEEVIVCHLGAQIMEMKAQLLKCFAPIIQRLLRGNLIQYSDPEKLSSWYILQVRERFRKSPNYSSNRSAESDLALLVSLLHAKSLLTGHGLSSFREQIMSWGEERKKGKMSWSKREMLQSTEFQALELSLAVTPGTNISTTASHPKLVKLREVLLEHFQRHAVGKSSTRAIVFTQYRASVSEIVALLRPLAPLLSAQPFIGQGASGKAKENKGQTQKVQQEIVRRFRLGEFNVLVATCIAEEGLDIGEVDLIVSFDALTSPVRMIQRMGRTGRKRVGRVIILVTEGDEQKKLARSASAAKTVSRALTTFKNKFTYSKCPRMLPTCLYPQLSELEMKIPTFHASQVGGKAASGAVDPDLWQLSDAERAVAMMKYFPPNFASSSRNKLFPVVANRLHLLRYQPRSLVRKGVSNRVGYSARSLMLQRLVRKINGVEEVLDSESDDEEDKSDDNGDQKNTLNSSNAVEGASTDDDDHLPTSPRLEASENPGRSSVTTNNAEIDSEMVSPWRPTSTPGDLGDARRCDESFAVMDESVNFVDMHFSPQFVETATQFASAAEVDEPSRDSNKRQQESQGQISSAKKQKTDSCSQDLSPVICTPKGPIQASETSAAANDKGAQTEDVLVHAFGDQRISTENLENEQLSATSSLTLTSDSPRPSPSSRVEAHQQQEVVVVIEANNSTEPTQQLPIVPRLHGIRQLQFDEDAGEGDDWDQTQSAEMPQDELAVPTANAGPPSENHDVCPVEDEPPIFSFALLQPRIDTKIGTKAESDASDGDQAEVEPSAYSFALLPPLDEKTGVVLEPTNIAAAPQKEASQQVDDGTDGDELDENEANTMINNELAVDTGSTADMNASVMDTAAVKHDENVNPEDPILSPKPRTTVDIDAAQQPPQSERKDTEPEQEDEDGCSICLESESYHDDPIVFCDGCNVAVHQFCYGIRTVPSDKWFCDVCKGARTRDSTASPSQLRCQLCPQRGGAFKRTECGQWVHVQCFLWIPEFRVVQGDDDMLVLGALSSLDPDRKTLDCSLCHSAKGHGIIQCAHKRCMAAFHVSCAAYAHYRMDQLDPPTGEGTESGTLFIAYCPLHRNSTAPVSVPEQHKTPPAAKARSPKPPLPTSATRGSSPSHLLGSPSSAEAKKKRKTFRRLKRKYDASQSQIFTQPGTKGSPAGTSPWQKRIRRSKQRRETSRALAAAFIDDTAEVRGGARDDDDEDDYGDDYKDAADDSFINDSSQLLYSQSVVFPGDAGSSSTKKQKRKKSSPNMRAIYARSLFESQGSPLLFRRGGRQLGALPSNGIIRACLDELHNGPTGADTPSPRPRSRSRLPETLEDAAAMPSIFSAQVGASATIMEVVDEDDSSAGAEPSPSFNLLEAAKAFSGVQHEIQIQTEKEGSAHANSVDPDMAPPSFSLLGANGSHSDGQETDLAKTTTQQVASVAVNSSKKPHGDDMHNMIEANRLKALKKLEERRQAKLQAQQPQQRPSHEDKLPAPQLDKGQEANTSHDIGHGFTSAASLVSRKAHEDEKAPPTFSLLPSTSSRGLMSPARGAQVPTVDLTSPEPTTSGPTQSQSQPPKWIVFVSSSFASSSDFPTFALAKHTECTVAIDEALEADALLSVRVGVLVLTVQQLRELARSAPARNVAKSRRIGTMLAMHKKVVVAIVHDGKDPPEVPRLRQLPNAMVIVQPHLQSLSANLHQLAQQELAKGYELPSPSLCRSDFNGGAVRGLDADFASRLDFFRSIPPMSLGSALSLSFRFKNFAVAQVPVLKFNEMHWRRMLPWISEPTAEAIRKHVQQNLQRS
ncbi:hypothetical protein KRP22_008013 [Phytophthora ramorum]|nr:Fanconi anemia group M protein [Phytophthora ramorum]